MKALLDLFARHRNRETGIWTLGADPQRVIYLDQGQIAFAQSTHPLDKLTTLLVERGKLTQAQLDYALQNLKPGLSIGRNLIEMGFITQRDLLEMAKAQVERVVWGAMGNLEEEPRFQAQALDATVVRLSLDTPLTLLVGCLHLRDRERLLELLGPLEQRVALETRLELSLPPDLAKVPALLDGQRRLLDLAQETGVEPMRLGAFALFLREMGYGHLTLGLPAGSAPLAPLPPPGPASSLLASIEAAQQPTMDLGHLAQALDDLEVAEPLELSDELPPDLADPQEPVIRIQAETSGSFELPPSEPRRPRWPLWIGILLLLGAGGLTAGWLWTRPAPAGPAPTASTSTGAPAPESEVLGQAPAPRDLPPAHTPSIGSSANGEPRPVPASAPVPAPSQQPPTAGVQTQATQATQAPRAETSPAERWATLQRGDWDRALVQGSTHREALGSAWVLRLEVACLPDTLARAVSAFKAPVDLFLVPIHMKDGRTCRQICLGTFRSQQEAQAAIQRLPTLFTQGGNRPRPYQAVSLPENQ